MVEKVTVEKVTLDRPATVPVEKPAGPEWTQAPFHLQKTGETEFSFKSTLPNGGEISGSVEAETEAEAKVKLGSVYPGITFA